MDHPLCTISYVSDIDNVLVIMANRGPPSTHGTGAESPGHIPKLTCHVLEMADVSGNGKLRKTSTEASF